MCIRNFGECYFAEDIYLFISICAAAKLSTDIVPIVPILVITSILLKLHRLSTIPDYLRICSQ